MKFEKSNVKTVLDIDYLSEGDEGYFSDSLLELKELVENDCTKFYGKIVHIDRESESDDVFKSDIDNNYKFYFYLVCKVKTKDVEKFNHPLLSM